MKPNDIDFFIICLPRSGSTLMAALLSQNAHVSVANDIATFGDFYERSQKQSVWGKTLRSFDPEYRLRHWYYHRALNRQGFVKLVDRVFKSFESASSEFKNEYAVRFERERIIQAGDQFGYSVRTLLTAITHEFARVYGSGKAIDLLGLKSAAAYRYYRPLYAMFPTAKYIFLVRHPIDRTASIKHRNDNTLPHERHFDKYYGTFLEAYQEGKKLEHVIVTKYEDLIAEPEKEVRRVLTFLDPAMDAPRLELGSTFNYVKKEEIGASIHRERATGRRSILSPNDVSLITVRCSHFMKEFGYQ